VSEVRLSAERRTEFGKGGARRTRRAGKIPAVLYGHGAEAQHIALPAREFTLAIKRGGVNVLLTLEVEGGDQLAIPKAIQRHAIKGEFEHVDLLAVRLGETVTIELPLHVSGEVVSGGLLAQEVTSITVEAEATHLPEFVEVDVTGMEIGTQITAASLTLPTGVSLSASQDVEQILLVIGAAPTAEDLQGAAAEGAIASAPVEG
jgi:large subunit ribosomal protein L25